ncbi:hypothetical protein [Rhizobium leguminosarum]|uniref:hypothetical protein n=1 Tax=Rhizobium leguminosarum TaxID=384 RepID=UPI001C94106C|nr:hypothetical protein [Rhizobium leguminosarum]
MESARDQRGHDPADRQAGMTVQGHLKEMLKAVAFALGDELGERLVFGDGCTSALYITDPITLWNASGNRRC